jgi:hypothetical protein
MIWPGAAAHARALSHPPSQAIATAASASASASASATETPIISASGALAAAAAPPAGPPARHKSPPNGGRDSGGAPPGHPPRQCIPSASPFSENEQHLLRIIQSLQAELLAVQQRHEEALRCLREHRDMLAQCGSQFEEICELLNATMAGGDRDFDSILASFTELQLRRVQERRRLLAAAAAAPGPRAAPGSGDDEEPQPGAAAAPPPGSVTLA